MSDPKLEVANREAVGAMVKPNAKAMKLVGDTHALAAESKARKRLGSVMSQDQIIKSKIAEEREKREADERVKIEAKEQTRLVDKALSKSTHVHSKLEHATTAKALKIFGDDDLVSQNKECVGAMDTNHSNAKALKLMGDTHALAVNSKARRMMGSMMSPKQKALQVKSELMRHMSAN